MLISESSFSVDYDHKEKKRIEDEQLDKIINDEFGYKNLRIYLLIWIPIE